MSKRALNLNIGTRWFDEGKQLWFLHESSEGHDFVAVEAAHGTERALFDHARLASALSQAAGSSYTASTLPFKSFEFLGGETEISFHILKAVWNCNLKTYACQADTKAAVDRPTFSVSPDRQWGAYVDRYDLWVRHLADMQDTRVTHDGEQYKPYATEPGGSTGAITDRIRYPSRPVVNVLWSPNSKLFVTYRLDESRMKDSYLIQSAPPGSIGAARPVLHTYRYPYPGDAEVASARYAIVDPAKARIVETDLPTEELNYKPALLRREMWWSEDGAIVYAIFTDRNALTMSLFAVDAATGKSRLLVEEHGTSELEAVPGRDGAPVVKAIRHGEKVIWFSERDGWGHLYLYDAKTGALEGQITRGPWTVRKIEYFDESSGYVYFSAGGREAGQDPYLRHLYRIRLDGSDLELLTPENADHSISFSPDGGSFVDTYSRVDTVPVSVLRAVNGKAIQTLAKADLRGLTASGWRFPEPFQAKAADGATDVYGAIFRPSNFDPRLSYPVLDSPYPGPQSIRTPKNLPAAIDDNNPQALAELGFIVVTVDGRGTPLRSRAFHDVSYGHYGLSGSLEDHISALKEIAKRYPYMDLSRVGIYGHSGGGYAAVRAMLAYPEFYKVAVSSAGNHDQRGYLAEWGERYEGVFDDEKYQEASNSVLALKSPLKGKLLLEWGDMDDNVPPAFSLQLIDSLIKTNSDFDVIVLPNNNHYLSAVNPYFIRRRWDYFVENLLGKDVPHGYQITTADPDSYSLEPEE